MQISMSGAAAAVISPRSSAGALDRYRRRMVERAELERAAMRAATEDLQLATDHVARIAIVGVRLARCCWLVAGALFKRERPMLRMARTVLVIWRTMHLLRNTPIVHRK